MTTFISWVFRSSWKLKYTISFEMTSWNTVSCIQQGCKMHELYCLDYRKLNPLAGVLHHRIVERLVKVAVELVAALQVALHGLGQRRKNICHVHADGLCVVLLRKFFSHHVMHLECGLGAAKEVEGFVGGGNAAALADDLNPAN